MTTHFVVDHHAGNLDNPVDQSSSSVLFKLLTHYGVDHELVDVDLLVGPAFYLREILTVSPEQDYLRDISHQCLEFIRSGQVRLIFLSLTADEDPLLVFSQLVELSDKYQIPLDHMRWITANRSQSTKHPFVYFPTYELTTAVANQMFVRQVNTNPRNRAVSFLSQGDYYTHRLLAASIWYHGLMERTHFAYPNPHGTNSVALAPLKKWKKFWQDPMGLIENFDMHLPLGQDLLGLDPAVEYRALHSDAYWTVALERRHNKINTALSEQTFLPMLNLQPFVLVAPAGSLKSLKEQGYETFGEWIDEGYDRIKSDEERLNVTFQIIFELCNLPESELHRMNREMIPVLAHNQQLLLSPKREKLRTLLAKLQ
jgi:hypothetical protein